ncbi:P-loop containing nucleoside triphosphate hydrolase protein [Sistotremastrum niveocremeum HHB9708]|uniref:RNA helicase n=1 Tax=Sistotremastrum niveocremeum HHB9708 TaxID=1314777 RepID=A0A164YYN0_9AGAM|nr:P-loop containing nucleoside triphosphate hydrolase protein [Sistotremastrum niveocremeum HHB9708]
MTDVAEICKNLSISGTCDVPNCPFNHDIHLCNVCDTICKSDFTWKMHLQGAFHAKRKRQLILRAARTGSYSPVYCQICNCNLYTHDDLVNHASAKRHRNAAFRAGLDPGRGNGRVFTPIDLIHCPTCNKDIRAEKWDYHSESVSHRRAEGFKTISAAFENAEEDKNGITITEGKIDFGVVEWIESPIGPDRTRRREILVKNTIPSSFVVLKEVRLSSSHSQSSSSPFKVLRPTPSIRVTTTKALPVTFTLSTEHAGRFEERVNFVFHDNQLNQQFIIMRTLVAIVGDQADYEAFKPKAPYVRPTRRTRSGVKDIVPGIAPPALDVIPWVVKLPQSPIPDYLSQMMSTGSHHDIERSIKDSILPRVFDSDTYGSYLSTLLHVEEYKMEADLQIYDLSDVFADPTPGGYSTYIIKVPGLAEKRPSVIIGDGILLQEVGHEETGKWYEGRVHEVLQLEVVLKFAPTFHGLKGMKYNVRFQLNRYPLRRMHQALRSAFQSSRVLFPTLNDLKRRTRSTSAELGALTVVNKLIASNPPQLASVAAIVNLPAGSPPFVVWGPPGTGKTVTVVEAIRQLLIKDPAAVIFACTPSNSAADLIAERLEDLGPSVLFRLVAPTRSPSQIPASLKKFTSINDRNHFSVPNLTVLKRFRVIVSTCVSAVIPFGMGLGRGHFTHIFIDEAGQASEPEVMIPIKTMSDTKTNVILSGDPMQLGPIIHSPVAIRLGLDKSYLCRLTEFPVYDEESQDGVTIVKLRKNWRSHAAILKFPNERFYGGDLECCADSAITSSMLRSDIIVKPNFPIVFHAIAGKDDREASSPSFFNIGEISLIKKYVNDLVSDQRLRLANTQIGVIAPYHAQCQKIRMALKPSAPGVKVGSVEEFQGQERRVILISTVRSSLDFIKFDIRHTLGFVANPRRFNVAVTRAQALLIIVGDPKVLSLDPLWRSFMNYVYNGGGWKGPKPDWDTSEAVNEAGGYDKTIRVQAEKEMNELEELLKTVVQGGEAPGQGDDEVVYDKVGRVEE